MEEGGLCEWRVRLWESEGRGSRSCRVCEASKRMNGRQRQRRLVWQSMPTATISGTEATTDYRGRESIYHDKIHSAV